MRVLGGDPGIADQAACGGGFLALGGMTAAAASLAGPFYNSTLCLQTAGCRGGRSTKGIAHRDSGAVPQHAKRGVPREQRRVMMTSSGEQWGQPPPAVLRSDGSRDIPTDSTYVSRHVINRPGPS